MRDAVGALCLLVVIAAATVAGRDQDGASRPTFRSGITLASVSATVRGRDDRLLTDLDRNEFRITVDRRPAAIDVFDVQRVPLQMVLLFGAVFSPLDRVREVGAALIDAMAPPDAATIGSYSVGVALSPLHTGNPNILRRVLAEELWFESGRNPIGAAADLAIVRLSRVSGRRAVVVVGPDLRQLCVGELPCADIDDAAARASANRVMVYGVNVVMPHGLRNDRPMRALARSSGGGYVSVEEAANLAVLMKEVLDELRHEYVLGFRLDTDTYRTEQVAVTTTRPGGQVRAQVALDRTAR
jgi:VWFA-related protein